MPSVKDMMGDLAKAAGEEGTFGGAWGQVERIPFGMFPLDLATGGGAPRNRITEIYGPEGAGKTNLALALIRENQRIAPEQTNAFVDMEGSWDESWAMKMGIDTKKVFVVRPVYAGHAVDTVDKLMHADDIGIVVFDSVAAMLTEKEGTKDAEALDPGKRAILVQKMVTKANTVLKATRDVTTRGPALILLNQIRSKIGVMFGNPETTPGGAAPKFYASLRLRIWGKNRVEAKISEVLPAVKETSVVVQKFKVPITRLQAEYDLVTLPHGVFKIGDIDDWNLIEELLKADDLLGKAGTKWVMLGEQYPTLTACRDRYRGDKAFRSELQSNLIAKAVRATGYVMTDEEMAKADQIEEVVTADGEIIEVPLTKEAKDALPPATAKKKAK